MGSRKLTLADVKARPLDDLLHEASSVIYRAAISHTDLE